jgi:pimeloyl-ACP methyl ester carboxylesterase
MLVAELPKLEQRLGEIGAPTTIVCGSADRVVPRAAARALAAQISGSQLVELKNAGHLLPQRHAGRLATLILDVTRRVA